MADPTTTAGKPETKPSTSQSAPADGTPESKTESTDTAATDTGHSTSDAPAGYSRGENQKAVTDAYRKNWDKIFGGKSGD